MQTPWKVTALCFYPPLSAPPHQPRLLSTKFFIIRMVIRYQQTPFSQRCHVHMFYTITCPYAISRSLARLMKDGARIALVWYISFWSGNRFNRSWFFCLDHNYIVLGSILLSILIINFSRSFFHSSISEPVSSSYQVDHSPSSKTFKPPVLQ